VTQIREGLFAHFVVHGHRMAPAAMMMLSPSRALKHYRFFFEDHGFGQQAVFLRKWARAASRPPEPRQAADGGRITMSKPIWPRINLINADKNRFEQNMCFSYTRLKQRRPRLITGLASRAAQFGAAQVLILRHDNPGGTVRRVARELKDLWFRAPYLKPGRNRIVRQRSLVPLADHLRFAIHLSNDGRPIAERQRALGAR
jgi:hypothetical protein